MWLLNRIQHDLSSWAHNFFQTPLWIKHTPEDLADVRNPRLEYSIYWIIKSAEVSSVISKSSNIFWYFFLIKQLGGLIVHPIYRYYLIKKLTPETTTNNSHKKIRNACRRMQVSKSTKFSFCKIVFIPGSLSNRSNMYSTSSFCDLFRVY
jgi:hypothetical protein